MPRTSTLPAAATREARISRLARPSAPLAMALALLVAGLWLPGGFGPGSSAIAQEETPSHMQNVGVVANPNTREQYVRGLEALRRAAMLESRVTDLQTRAANAGTAVERTRFEQEAQRLTATVSSVYAEGVEKLQELIADDEFRGHVIQRHELGLFAGARRSALEALLRAGEPALEAYRRLYDMVAEDAMRRARAMRNLDALEAVLMEYPFATAAVEAGKLAASLAWESGDTQRAAAMCRRLLLRDDLTDPDGAYLLTIAASSYSRNGDTHGTQSMLDLAEARYADARVMMGDRMRRLVTALRDLHEQAVSREASPDIAAVWPTVGGNATHNRILQTEPDATRVKWERRLPRETNGRVDSFNTHYPQFGLPRRFPVVADYTAFVPDRTGIVAYNLFNGQEMWSVRNEADAGEFWIAEIDPAVTYGATVAGDLVIAPLEVPLLRELHDPSGTAEHANGVLGTKVIIHVPRRQLTGIDRRTGEVHWRIGADWRESERPVAECLSYTGAPVVAGNLILCSAARLYDDNAHTYAVCWEMQDDPTERPELKWITKLVTGLQETNLFGRPTREPFPTAVAYRDHHVYICTNMGLTAMLDANTGEQMWTVPYDRIPFVPPVRLHPSYRRPTWFNNPPIVVEGALLVTPIDSDYLYCYDADTGELRWAFPRATRDSGARYLFGAGNGRVWFGGGEYLYEVDLVSGRLSRNPLRLPSAHRMSSVPGTPIRVGNELYLPLSDSITVVDLEGMRVVRTIRNGLGQHAGNLAMGDGVLVSLVELSSRTPRLAASYDWTGILAGLRAQERAHPDSFQIKLRIANLARQQGPGSWGEALQQFERVVEMTANATSQEAEQANRDAHRGLLALWMDEAARARERGDTQSVLRALQEAKGHVQQPRDGVEVALVELEVVEGQGNRTEQVLRDLLARYPETRHEFGRHGTMSVAQFCHISLARLAEERQRYAGAMQHWQTLLEQFASEPFGEWTMHQYAANQQKRLLERGGAPAYAAIEREARRALESAVGRHDRNALLHVVRRYPVSNAAQEALLVHAEWDLADAGDSGEPAPYLDSASRVLLQLRSSYPDSELRSLIYLMLIEVFEARESWHAARGILQLLQREYGGQTIDQRGRRVDVDNWVTRKLEREEYQRLSSGGELPVLAEPPLELKGSTMVGEETNPRLLEPGGTPPSGLGPRYFVTRRRTLECRDAVTGDLLWANFDATFVYEVAWVNDHVVAVTTSSVLGIDPESGDILWRRNLQEQVQEARIAGGVAAVILREHRASDQSIQFSLVMVNASDGTMLGRSTEKFSALLLAKPQVMGATVIVHSLSPGRVIGFSITNPVRPAFQVSFDSRLAGAPMQIDDRRFAVVTRESAIEVMRLADGGLLRRIAVPDSVLAERIFATDTSVIYCDTNGRVVAIDAATGVQRWVHELDRRDMILQNSRLIPNALLLLHKSFDTSNGGRQQRIYATALNVDSGTPLWQVPVQDDLRFDCQGSIVTADHVVLNMRKIVSRTVIENGRREHNVLAQLELFIIQRSDGNLVQTITPELGKNLVPSVLVQDGNLLVTADDRILRYGR